MAGGGDERTQRVRVGLTGLAAVLVIVAAVAAIVEGARENEVASVPNSAEPESTESVEEPLAEIGVVPPSEPVANGQIDLEAPPPAAIEPTPPPQPID